MWCSTPWATTTKADLGITGTEKMKVTTGDDITKELLSGTLQISMSIVQALEDGIAQSVRAATILRNMLREDFTTLAKSAKSEHHRYNVNAATTIARKPNEHHPGCTLRRTGRGSPYDDYTIRDDTILCGVSRCAGYLAPLVSRTLRLSWPMESKQLPKQHRIGYICTESHNFIGYSFSTFRPLVVVVVRTTAGYNHGPTALPTKALSRSSRTEAAMDLLQRLAIITILVNPLTTA